MSLKNWYGLLGNPRNQFHQDIHGIISDFAKMMKPTFVIADGRKLLMRNGPTGGSLNDVKQADALVVGTDHVAVDSWCVTELLERKWDDVLLPRPHHPPRPGRPRHQGRLEPELERPLGPRDHALLIRSCVDDPDSEDDAMLKVGPRPGALTIRFRPGLRLSDEAFWRLCGANPDLDLERSSRGELVILMSPSGLNSDDRHMAVIQRLRNWHDRSQLGKPFGPTAGFILPNSAIRGPDAAWISQEHWDSIPPADSRNGSVVSAPTSSSRSARRPTAKGPSAPRCGEYIANGARLGWLIDPTIKAQTVEVYRPDRDVEILRHPQAISADPVVPGFTLDLSGILS